MEPASPLRMGSRPTGGSLLSLLLRWSPVFFILAIIALARSISLPALQINLALTADNSAFYAYRFANPTLFPNDLWGQYAREIYPFFSVAHWVPALLLRFAGVDPIPVIGVEIILIDLGIALALYALARQLGVRPAASLLAVMIFLGARVVSWNLASYDYIGAWLSYPGDMYLAAGVLVIWLLASGRTGWALLLTGAAAWIHVAQAASLVVVVAVYLLLTRRQHPWRGLAKWAAGGTLLFMLGALPGLYAGLISNSKPMTVDQWWDVVRLNHHIVPWLSWAGWLWCLPFIQWALLWGLSLRSLGERRPATRSVLYAVWGSTLGLCLVAFAFIGLRQPSLMLLGFFRITTLFNLVALPLVANYLVDKLVSGKWLPSLLAAGVVLALGDFRHPPFWILLAALAAIDVADGWLGCWSVSMPAWGSLTLRVVGWLLLLGFGGALSIIAWVPSTAEFDKSLTVATWLVEGTLAPAGIKLWLFSVVALVGSAWLLARLGVAQARQLLPVVVALALAGPYLDEARTIAALGSNPTYQDWMATQVWARNNTPVDAAFIGFPSGGYPDEWRTFSQRSLVDLTWRGLAIYVRDGLVAEIDNRSGLLLGIDPSKAVSRLQLNIDTYQAYRGLTSTDFMRIATQTGARYALAQRPDTFEFAVVYENAHFAVYDLARPNHRERQTSLVIPNGDFETLTAEGRPAQWGTVQAALSATSQAFSGRQAAHVVFDSPDSLGWLYTGGGDMLSPPGEAAFQVVAGDLYRIRSELRGEDCPSVHMFAVEFNSQGESKLTALGWQMFLTQRYIFNPHLYVSQVAFFRPEAGTVAFRFALRYTYDSPVPRKLCQLDVDQVDVTRIETLP